MKKPTYQELEEEIIEWKWRTFLFVVCFAILMVSSFTLVSQKDTLKQQNQALQEKCKTIWTLDYICNWNNIGENLTAHYEFTNYSKYKEQLFFVEHTLKNCEVQG